jgi:NAD+ synthase (glutamine-hydrolysing)
MTFNGDHMSMYHVNAGVPKTLVRYLVPGAPTSFSASETDGRAAHIVATPITPELLPLGADERWNRRRRRPSAPTSCTISSCTRRCATRIAPAKVFLLARQAFGGAYTDAGRSCAGWRSSTGASSASSSSVRPCPTAPRWARVALSPRGDWRMPSDAVAAVWLVELAAVTQVAGAA